MAKKMNKRSAKKPTVNIEYASKFVTKVKTRFGRAHQHHVYPLFLSILNSYRENKRSLDDVIRDVNLLFEGHDDLIDDFTNFLP
ncbi:paired amphipathic helix protein Sin3-like 6 [Vicia villosa]|uniref:paired amphipathic helix protein Sin3-like 6 n=1 Tax=Vicia villosa TaxID=3911 RepID=UPI00273BCD67|nr:paired amphipathic helix protein Sin3-like 6 [Vicia villosa]